ncbi:hypothetical protein J6590_050246 [Homalodisca vitripennis]|nr:hypothetical protein J6590_050246 [Homalodisca vitripennis]
MKRAGKLRAGLPSRVRPHANPSSPRSRASTPTRPLYRIYTCILYLEVALSQAPSPPRYATVESITQS